MSNTPGSRESGYTKTMHIKPARASFRGDFRICMPCWEISNASFGDTCMASRAGCSAARMATRTVIAKLNPNSHQLKDNLSTCTRTNRVEIVWLTPPRRYLTKKLLIGIAITQPATPKGDWVTLRWNAKQPTHGAGRRRSTPPGCTPETFPQTMKQNLRSIDSADRP